MLYVYICMHEYIIYTNIYFVFLSADAGTYRTFEYIRGIHAHIFEFSVRSEFVVLFLTFDCEFGFDLRLLCHFDDAFLPRQS